MENKVLVNNNIISLQYIKNKIKAYNNNPFETLNNTKDNEDFLSNYSLLISYLKIGKYDLAYKKLTLLKNEYKNYPFFYELKGDIHYKEGDFANAIAEYKKAIRTINKVFIPSSDIIKFSLVKTYLQTNNKNHLNKSIMILEELLLNNPNSSFLWKLLAKSSGRLNKKGVSYIALAEEALIKKNFIKAKKYVDLAFKQSNLPSSYKLRGADIIARIKVNKLSNK
tara:strand:- start:90 stop:761 length:672 start_codon:yes stop_codon:yes gene_type:complete